MIGKKRKNQSKSGDDMAKKYTEEQLKEALEIYKENHKDSVYIPQNAVVTLKDGTKVNLGTWGSHMKSRLKTISSELKKEVLFLYPKHFEDNKRSYSLAQLKEALVFYKKEHKDSKYIPTNAIVTLKDGTKVNLGTWGNNIKSGSTKISFELEKLVYTLFPKQFEEVRKIYTEEQIKEALRLYKKGHKNSEFIPQNAIVILKDGMKINLGTWGRNVKSGITKISSELRQEVLTFYPNQFEIRKKTKTGKESISPLEKYKELFKGDEVKAKQVVECLRKLREKRQAKKSYEWNIEDVLQEFHIDRKQLDSYLKKTVKEERKSTSLEYHGQDLHSYCLEQGYNYEILVKALRLHSFCGHDTLEQLINRILTQTPNRIPTWIYENYGTLIEQKLIWLKLDKSKILKSMSQNIIPLEEAIRHDIFLQERKEQTNDWLEEPYNYLVAQINSGQGRKETEENLAYNFYMLVKKYHLTPSEYQILWNSISHYINTIHSYQIIDVGLAGRTIDKIEKIKKYQLDQDDIKESYLFALSFDKKLSQRSDLLRSFLMKKGSDIQEVQKSLKNTLTEKEFSAIQKIKAEMNQTIQKVKKLKL